MNFCAGGAEPPEMFQRTKCLIVQHLMPELRDNALQELTEVVKNQFSGVCFLFAVIVKLSRMSQRSGRFLDPEMSLNRRRLIVGSAFLEGKTVHGAGSIAVVLLRYHQFALAGRNFRVSNAVHLLRCEHARLHTDSF
ncbi:hypothetical protein MLD38_020393 [Melastoma candidum]|uniref:Uncharacterized protein n=1 Tax=Melastoma candidum TaxID=119954 RepID=A0ACB9QGK4_9MYRT|nr:hypothetical protein MLD38_020393 [Melastoma candidum]